jgi:imidazolonepropionase-like amidohydrolase
LNRARRYADFQCDLKNESIFEITLASGKIPGQALAPVLNPTGQLLPRAILWLSLSLFAVESVSASDLLPPGYRPLPLGTHALVGGKIFIKPGETLDSGTVVIRDGLIQAVGKDVSIPADARVWDMKGMAIYAGFIDPYLVMSGSNSPVSTSESEPIAAGSLTSGAGVKFYGAPGDRTDMGRPGPSYQIAQVTPDAEVARTYSPDDKSLEPLREIGFTVGSITPSRGVIRGTSALVALVDDDPNKVILKPDVFQHIAFSSGGRGGGGEGAFPGSLMGVIAAVRQSFFDAQHDALDVANYARHPQGRRRPDYNPGSAALAPALQKTMRVVFEPGSVLMDDRAAQVSREVGVDFALVACGQEWRRPDLVKQTGAPFIVPLNFPTLPKLPSEDDWEQVTMDELRAWDWAPENPELLRQQGLDIAFTTYGLEDKKDFRKNLRQALDRGLSEVDALAALTTTPATLCGVDSQLGTIAAGKLANLTVVSGTNYFDPESKVREVWIDGRIYPSPVDEPKDKDAKDGKDTNASPAFAKNGAPTNAVASTNASSSTNAVASKKSEETRDLQKKRVAKSPMDGRGPIVSPRSIVITNAVVWTSAESGIITNVEILVSDGIIQKVGHLDSIPGDALILDVGGENVTPGIIDCHSHSFVVGAVNESSLPSTAMVRIRDVVNSETANIHEQLAGGVTAANVLHGSANPIGGQNCVIKLRDGASPEDMIFSNAPQGIKFALGENVKQSNWGENNTTRFPQTRMGVRTFYQNRFTAAQQCLEDWDNYRKLPAGSDAVPPRRDLELEAIGEIIQGKRWIHCHGYRQDEMLALVRLMQGFGVQIGSFQHGLEGYKIADELAAAKVTVSCFSDWWAYKFEVYDSIPYNGAIMHDRGVVVSFNSDSSDFARRLYLEAAKAVKYGGVSETEALKFVTLNPAIQLRIDKWVGSIEPGKDADFVVWSKSPLASDTVCEQTWIDGKKYFDRSLETARAAALTKERDDLIAKAKKLSKPKGDGDEGKGKSGNHFFDVSLEHEFDGIVRHCLDEE